MTESQEPSPSIAPAEWEVMKVLWEQGPLAARDVFAALPEDSEWAYKTAKTLLARLVAKGAVEYDQIGNSYLYRAAVDRDRITRDEVRTLFDRIMSQALSPVLAHFIEEAELSDEEIGQLKRTLDNKRKKPSSRSPRVDGERP